MREWPRNTTRFSARCDLGVKNVKFSGPPLCEQWSQSCRSLKKLSSSATVSGLNEMLSGVEPCSINSRCRASEHWWFEEIHLPLWDTIGSLEPPHCPVAHRYQFAKMGGKKQNKSIILCTRIKTCGIIKVPVSPPAVIFLIAVSLFEQSSHVSKGVQISAVRR